MADKPDMSDDEQREIVAAIARDHEAYPRDRVNAIRALRELGFEKPAVDDADGGRSRQGANRSIKLESETPGTSPGVSGTGRRDMCVVFWEGGRTFRRCGRG
jgi:hypothetical protein